MTRVQMVKSACDNCAAKREGRCLLVVNYIFEQVFARKCCLSHFGPEDFDRFMCDFMHIDDLRHTSSQYCLFQIDCMLCECLVQLALRDNRVSPIGVGLWVVVHLTNVVVRQ